jgi:hypothetical protein
MTTYSVFLEAGDPNVVQDISPADTILVTVGASYGTTGNWASLSPTGCTLNFTTGSDGSTTTLTPISGATSYSVTFRTRDTEQAIWYSSVLSGTISSGASDTTPDAFTFTDQTGVALNSTIISNTITVSGINAASAISISGGTYSINGGAYTSSSGTVTNGQTVTVAHTSSGSNGTAVNTTLTIGGVSDTFTSTTAAAATYILNFYDSSFASTRTNFNEGEGVYAFLSTTAPDGTTLYWSTSSGSDISPVNGSLSVSYGFASVFFTIAADSLTEGTETLTFYIRSGSVSGTVLTSSSITINDTSTTPAPVATYSVGNTSTNEGASATANVSTTNVANGTTLYWTVNATTADVSTTSGSFTINSNAGSFTIPAIADSLTEGSEAYTISIRTGSTSGTVVASSTLTINDTSTTPAPTYAINFYDTNYSPKTTFNEGEQAFVFINTTNVPDGTTLYWSTSSPSDLVAPVSGSFVVNFNFTSTTLTIATDSLTEGTESLTFYVRSGSVSGTVLTSSSITINDTSTTPGPTYSVSNASTNEGASATANVTTTNVANGTTLYWTVDASTADVSTTSGSFTISSNAGSFTIPAIADSTTEGTEYYTISVRTGSTAGTVVASSTLTINDTSTTPATDTTPDAFSFTSQTGVPLSTLTSSNEVQIFGINTGAPISISGGEYSIALDPTTYTVFTSSAGTIYNGQSIKVRHTSSASTNTNTTTTLTIGGISATFTSTTTSVIPAVYGMRIYDASGNITLDTTDETMKDLGIFTINSVTTNQSILNVPVTTNSIALVNNNNGDTNTSVAAALVSLNIATSSISISGGFTGFDISIRIMEF